MISRSFWFHCFLWLSLSWSYLQANLFLTPPSSLDISNQGEVVYLAKSQEIIYKNNVRIKTDTGASIFADYAKINTAQSQVYFKGNVSLFFQEGLHHCEELTYYYKNKQFNLSSTKGRYGQLLMKADKLYVDSSDALKPIYTAEQFAVTTDDSQTPAFWMKSKKTTFYPQPEPGYLVFKGLTVTTKNTPVFKLPYFPQSIHPELGYHLSPRSSSALGYELYQDFGFTLDKLSGQDQHTDILIQPQLSLYSKRGVGAGLLIKPLNQNVQDATTPHLHLFGINDAESQEVRGSNQIDNIDSERYAVSFNYLNTPDYNKVDEFTNDQTRITAQLNFLSDDRVLEDFFEDKYQDYPENQNLLEFIYLNPTWGDISINTTWSDQGLFQTTQRLPELNWSKSATNLANLDGALDNLNLSLFDNIYYEGSASVGIYEEQSSDATTDSLFAELIAPGTSAARAAIIRDLLVDNEYQKIHTFHQLSRPFKISNLAAITPTLGWGFNQYSSADSSAGSDQSDYQNIVHTTIKASLFLSGQNTQLDLPHWGLAGLYHHLEPYVQVSWLKIDDLSAQITPINRYDYILDSPSLNLAQNKNTENLKDWGIYRFGVEQSLTTKRYSEKSSQNHTWFNSNTYWDVYEHNDQSNFKHSGLYHKMAWTPKSALSFISDSHFPLGADSEPYLYSSNQVNFLLNDFSKTSIGSYQLKNHPILSDANSVNWRHYQRFSSALGLEYNQFWNLETSTLRSQEIRAYLNLKNWVGSFGIEELRHNNAEDEYIISINFTLKRFPEARLPLSL